MKINKQERIWIREIKDLTYCGQVQNPVDLVGKSKIYDRYVEVQKLVNKCLDLFLYVDAPKDELKEEMEGYIQNLKNLQNKKY